MRITIQSLILCWKAEVIKQKHKTKSLSYLLAKKKIKYENIKACTFVPFDLIFHQAELKGLLVFMVWFLFLHTVLMQTQNQQQINNSLQDFMRI